MSHCLENLSLQQRRQLGVDLLNLRNDLANGAFLQKNLYTIDHSKLAGNTHHFWIRLELNPNSFSVIRNLVTEPLPQPQCDWLNSQLERKIFQRMPTEYSSLIKIPFSVTLGEVGDAREKQTKKAIKHELPATIPYPILHLEINRLIRINGDKIKPPTDSEFAPLLAYYSRHAIVKARNRYPEVWDELRGHYVLDSRGGRFARSLVMELKKRGLLSSTTQFIDIGSGVGTNVFAVDRYSDAHATGVEKHEGLFDQSNVLKRRLERLNWYRKSRSNFVLGDAFDNSAIDLARFDVFYVYSPIGKWTIDIDDIVDKAKVGAVLLYNRLPERNLDAIETLKKVAGLFAFRKVA